MSTRPPMAPLTVLVAATLAVCAGTVAPAAEPFTDGTVFDTSGGVIINRGASSVTAARGVVVRRGDRVMVPESGVLTIRCPESNAVRVDTPGTFTFSGCQPAVAAEPPPAPEPVAAPVSAPTPSAPPAPVARTHSGGGSTLGIIGGIALLGAAAGGGGGGGGGSGSTSPPVSP